MSSMKHDPKWRGGLGSMLGSATVFCLGAAMAIGEVSALAVWPSVFIAAAIQHLVIAAPAYLLVTRLWGPIDRSPLWSFGLWGAGLAAGPWTLFLVIADARTGFTSANLYVAFLVLTAVAGATGGVIFGRLLKQPLCSTC